MVFVGGGALLSHAVGVSLAQGLDVQRVCCPENDPALPRLQRLGAPLLPSNDPNRDLPPHLAATGADVVVSINNRFLLDDALLAGGPRVYNIHNGLVQRYRGRAEICVVAALCQGATTYGATLHRLRPGQNVDTGPVVDQREFAIGPDDDFASVFARGIEACRALFEANATALAAGEPPERAVDHEGRAWRYADLPRLIAEATPPRLDRARRLGPFAAFFPALAAAFVAPEPHAAA